MPIYQSTTYTYDSAEEIGKLFDLAPGHMYSRISNPTVEMVENKIAALEGGIGALCTTSGQAASLISILNICSAGDHFLATSTIYGGTINLFNVTLRRLGIECTFISGDASDEEIAAEIRPNTRLIFGESLANPALTVLDIEKLARVAHGHDIPLIVDNTFPTPVLCRPIEFGADIVVHSTTKYMDGHAIQVGGVIVDSGNFDWDNGKYPELVEPDESYHGTCYTRDFGKMAYIVKARVQLMRDFGTYPAAINAFLLNLGLETLHLRIQHHSENAQAIAEFLHANDKVEFVNYPGLKTDPYYALAQKYMPGGASGVLSFSLKGGRDTALAFMKSLKLAKNVVHVAEVRTCVLHPASATHRQLTDEQLVAAGITPGLIRLSVGIEHVDDILDDIKNALDQI